MEAKKAPWNPLDLLVPWLSPLDTHTLEESNKTTKPISVYKKTCTTNKTKTKEKEEDQDEKENQTCFFHFLWVGAESREAWAYHYYYQETKKKKNGMVWYGGKESQKHGKQELLTGADIR